MVDIKKPGVLLINLGTPAAPDMQSVRAFLLQFLMDPLVLDVPVVLRWLLVHGVILRTRPKRSALAYQQIWTEQGSPLLVYSRALAERVAAALNDEMDVALGMRYGQPSISGALEKLKHCSSITVLPLFPQYSLAATESAIVETTAALKRCRFGGAVRIIGDFFDHKSFVTAWANQIKASALVDSPDHFILFSYHGLPVKQVYKAASCQKHCTGNGACEPIAAFNRRCYRAQCYATTRAVAAQLGLSPKHYAVAFQSRLGRIPWIRPYLDELLPQLYQQGVRHLSVACPSFVADCLETLEEIGLRAKRDWLAMGGVSLQLIPCVNDSSAMVKTVLDLVRASEAEA